MTTHRIWPGKPYPLGASYDGHGVNFAFFSENGTEVDLCLFDRALGEGARETLGLPERTAHIYHGYVPGLKPGQLYGIRVHGAYDPQRGLRFNPSKLLVDPYALAIASDVDWNGPMHPYELNDPRLDLVPSIRDNAAFAPKAVVIDDVFMWDDDRRPAIPWRDTVIYEVHVKGMTARHPDVPEKLRGTYAGLATEPVIHHLKRLGITTLELLPVHEIADEHQLIQRNLKNYWGYNTLGYFAPAGRYSSSGRHGEQVSEFKAMVKALHRAGIEVILDVVYNHTAEADHLGPILSLKGIDNPSYYRLAQGNRRFYTDYTGCGNSLNVSHPQTLKLIMDSLRYWVTEMHVDGFRFDLAATLARETHHVDRLSAFFDIIHQDPILSHTKLIAEPWDVGDGGYQVGNFPVLWTEWNGRYRDNVRKFWKGDHGVVGELGYRLTGSSDLYQTNGRRPHASINFVTAHDGFTLHDLTSYNRKHNEGNGENNRDGCDFNDSDNQGVEGETNAPAVRAIRERQKRNYLTTLLISQGVPMICGGDEIGRTQGGNNNAYCQDNEISWHDWNLDPARQELLEFTQRLVALRHRQPVLRRRQFFAGNYVRGSLLKDIVWYRPDGSEMTHPDWMNPSTAALAMLLGGDAIPTLDRFGRPVVGDTLLVLINGTTSPVSFVLPLIQTTDRWEVLVDTRSAKPPALLLPVDSCHWYPMIEKSMAILALPRAPSVTLPPGAPPPGMGI